VWEEWGGVDADGHAHASLNHYSKGAVITFLHQYVAGLRLIEPGYRRFAIAPTPGHGLTSARAHHDCPFGRIDVDWRVHDSRGVITVEVPSDTEATLTLPDGTSEQLTAGRHERSWASAR